MGLNRMRLLWATMWIGTAALVCHGQTPAAEFAEGTVVRATADRVEVEQHVPPDPNPQVITYAIGSGSELVNAQKLADLKHDDIVTIEYTVNDRKERVIRLLTLNPVNKVAPVLDEAIEGAGEAPAAPLAADAPRAGAGGGSTARAVKHAPQVKPLATGKIGPMIALADGGILLIEGNRAYTSRDGADWQSRGIFPDTAPAFSTVRSLYRTRRGTIVALGLSEDKVYSIRSLDEGNTWQDHAVVIPDPMLKVRPRTVRDGPGPLETDARLAAIAENPDGHLFSALRIIGSDADRLRRPDWAIVVPIYSMDQGATWYESNAIDLGGDFGRHAGAMHPAIEMLADGRMWMLISTPAGRFWQAVAAYPTEFNPSLGFHSPTTHPGQGEWFRTLSPSDIPGEAAPASLKRLASGRLALVHSSTFASESLSIAFSNDDGKSWTKPAELVRSEAGDAIADAWIFERQPGELWIMARQGQVGAVVREADFADMSLLVVSVIANRAADAPIAHPMVITRNDGSIVADYSSGSGTYPYPYAMYEHVDRRGNKGLLVDKGQQPPATDISRYPQGLWIDPRVKPNPSAGKRGHILPLPDGKLLHLGDQLASVSSDDGKTWEDHPIFPEGMVNKVGSEHPMVVADASGGGTIVACFSGDKAHPYAMRSLDGGKTWQDFFKFQNAVTGALRNMLIDRHGVIWVPIQTSFNGRCHVRPWYSTDHGKTWQSTNFIDVGGSGSHDGAMEPVMLEEQSGRLRIFVRTTLGLFWDAYADPVESRDQPRWFQHMGKSNIDASNSPCAVVRLTSGRLAMVWNSMCPEGMTSYISPGYPWYLHRMALSLAFSEDDGKTWSKPLTLTSAYPARGLSYPFMFERRPGELWLNIGPLDHVLYEKDFVSTNAKE